LPVEWAGECLGEAIWMEVLWYRVGHEAQAAPRSSLHPCFRATLARARVVNVALRHSPGSHLRKMARRSWLLSSGRGWRRGRVGRVATLGKTDPCAKERDCERGHIILQLYIALAGELSHRGIGGKRLLRARKPVEGASLLLRALVPELIKKLLMDGNVVKHFRELLIGCLAEASISVQVFTEIIANFLYEERMAV